MIPDKLRPQPAKGIPLCDFLDPNGFDLERVLRTSALKVEIERHVKAFGVRPSGADRDNAAHGRMSGRSFDANVDLDLEATDGHATPSLEDQLKAFLDGLYLGCLDSQVIQLKPGSPPQSYIYDIGFNTDKLTGFVISNPEDTLITFGPRGRHGSYGPGDPSGFRLPRVPSIKVQEVTPEPKKSKKGIGRLNPDFIGTFGTASGVDRGGGGNPRASIICDLNIRVVTNAAQQLQQVSIYGDTMRVHLSKRLVKPVERSAANEWVPTGKRLALEMGNRMITLRRGRLPTWGGPMDLGGSTVLISRSGLAARLHGIDLGGTVQRPLIVFSGVEIVG